MPISRLELKEILKMKFARQKLWRPQQKGDSNLKNNKQSDVTSFKLLVKVVRIFKMKNYFIFCTHIWSEVKTLWFGHDPLLNIPHYIVRDSYPYNDLPE